MSARLNAVQSSLKAAAPVRTLFTSAPRKTSSALPFWLGAGVGLSSVLYYYNNLADSVVVHAAPKVDPSLPAALDSNEFRSFKLSHVNKYNHNSSVFVFSLPQGTQAGLITASAVVVKSATPGEALGKDGKPAIRPYTPISHPNSAEDIELLIKHYPGGAIGDHVFGLKPGDELLIKGPIPKFKYTPNEFESISLIAGGSGVTPMHQLLAVIAADPTDKTKATLIFGNIAEEDILLREDFDKWAKAKPDQIKIVYLLDKPPAGWTGESGFLTKELAEKYIPKASPKTKAFVCGPPGLVKAVSGPKKSFSDQGEVTGILAELGYTPETVYKF